MTNEKQLPIASLDRDDVPSSPFRKRSQFPGEYDEIGRPNCSDHGYFECLIAAT